MGDVNHQHWDGLLMFIISLTTLQMVGLPDMWSDRRVNHCTDWYYGWWLGLGESQNQVGELLLLKYYSNPRDSKSLTTMLMAFYISTIWLFNIAMETPL